ncbi:MAG: hypothetical protein LUG16_08645 [Candidatus Gastranaerophilales bacterium]|nr:hypothetical protein [Candidatus Gastranaerophilales bacterium]
MQNTSNFEYITNAKVINIKSEMLFRQAEDELFYNNEINSAQKKLELSVKLTPAYLKSIILLADIYFLKGKIKKALDLYHRANKINPKNLKVLSSLCNAYYVLNNYEQTLKYYNLAVENIKNIEDSIFLSQLTEIKIDVLIQQKQYQKAYALYAQMQNTSKRKFLKNILDKKIKLKNKLFRSNLRIV